MAQLGFLEGIADDHKYRDSANREGARPRPRTVRLGKEIAGLNSDLPLNPTSSVFVRVDEQNVTVWRALITGESSGCSHSGDILEALACHWCMLTVAGASELFLTEPHHRPASRI